MERLGQRPARAGVGRVALMEHRDRRFVVRRLQVGEERRKLCAREQRLVDQRTARERAHEERLYLGTRIGDAPLDRAAGDVQRALPRGRIGAPVGGGDRRASCRERVWSWGGAVGGEKKMMSEEVWTREIE